MQNANLLKITMNHLKCLHYAQFNTLYYYDVHSPIETHIS